MDARWDSFFTASVLVLCRLSGLLVFAPLLSASSIPTRLRAALLFSMVVVVAPPVAAASGPVRLDGATVLEELVLGILFGLSAQLVLASTQIAGQVMGFQMGLGLEGAIDPNTQVEATSFGVLTSHLALLMLLSAGLDRALLRVVLGSFASVPVGCWHPDRGVAALLLREGGAMLLAGVQLALPVATATLMVDLAVALVSRAAPQLPAMFLGIPVKTGLGYGVLIGSLSLWPRFLEARLDRSLAVAGQLLHLGAGGR